MVIAQSILQRGAASVHCAAKRRRHLSFVRSPGDDGDDGAEPVAPPVTSPHTVHRCLNLLRHATPCTLWPVMISGLRFAAAGPVLFVAFATASQAQRVVAVAPPIAGISCDAMEGQRMHIHQRLTIVDHGKSVAIPENVGQRPAQRCLYWLHTHTPDGILHIEAPLDRKFTLGDFFAIWGQPLSRSQAATATAAKGTAFTVWVNGARYTGDPRKIDLVAHADIVIQIGKPNGKPVAFTTWGTL